jgi:hypothetical protein
VNTTQKVLSRATELLRSGWTQNEFATKRDGASCDYDNPDAACFCATGAIARASLDLGLPAKERIVARDVLRDLLRAEYADDVMGIVGWNDSYGQTQAEVVAMFKRATAAAGETTK